MSEKTDKGAEEEPNHQNKNARNGVGGAFDLMHDMLLQVGANEDNKSYPNYVWNKMFKRKVVFESGKPSLFDESIHIAEDLAWLLEVIPHAKRGVFDSTAYYHYRCNSSGLTKSDNSRIPAWLASQELHIAALEWLKGQGWNDLYEVHKRSCIRYFTSNYKAAVAMGNAASATKMLRNIQAIDENALSDIFFALLSKSGQTESTRQAQDQLLVRRSVKLAVHASDRARSFKHEAKEAGLRNALAQLVKAKR